MPTETKVDMKDKLMKLQQEKEFIRTSYHPIFEKDQKIGKAFQEFDRAIEERVKEIG